MPVTDTSTAAATAVPAAGAARTGLFIALEGGDGAGRSTQVRLLLPWLEEQGWATVHVGLGRSALVQRAFRAHRRTLEAGPQTLALLYAADLHDQAAGAVRTALASGFVVVADRWTATACTRCQVRGVDPAWLEGIMPTAPQPDLTVFLEVDVRQRLARTIQKRGIPDFRESGRDLGLDADPLRAFVRYQTLLDRQYARLASAQPAPWLPCPGDGPPALVQDAIRRVLLPLMGREGAMRHA